MCGTTGKKAGNCAWGWREVRKGLQKEIMFLLVLKSAQGLSGSSRCIKIKQQFRVNCGWCTKYKRVQQQRRNLKR